MKVVAGVAERSRLWLGHLAIAELLHMTGEHLDA